MTDLHVVDAAARQLLEHGVLGAVILFQFGVIFWLLRDVRKCLHKTDDLVDRVDIVEAQLKDR